MKKFVGNVNGKTFDNEQDFNLAAKEAIKSNDGHLSISSYYSYDEKKSNKIEDKDKDEPKIEKKKANLNKEDYILVDQKPNPITGYNVSSILYDKLVNADNKDDIKKNVDSLLSAIGDSLNDGKKVINKLELNLEAIEDELYDKKKYIEDLKLRRNYYNRIKNILNSTTSIRTSINNDSSDFKKVNFSGFDIFANDSLYSILKKLGL